MTKKIVSLSLFIMFIVFTTGFVGLNQASAETFPTGCASAIGFSTTNGAPCNGTSNSAIMGFLSGCTSILGYSITNGSPCSGGTVALQSVPGCVATTGYSIITGVPCNGTNVATPVFQIYPVTPGLPTTGSGGNALINTIALVASGMFVAFGLTYLFSKPQVTKIR